MLQTPFSASYLTPEDLALLFRVLAQLERPSDSAVDRQERTAALVQIFRSGICEEEELIKSLAQRDRA